MEAPAITRHRRPFLAPLWIMAAAGLIAIALAVVAYRSLVTTTVVLVRHAEKELSTIDDPPLTPEGERRAERLAQMFGRITDLGRLDAIYVSDTRRTQQTAAALATRLGLEPVVMPGADVSAIARRAMRDHRGGKVLVVGHSNTIPQLVKQMADADIPAIADDDFDNIYVVSAPTLGKASVLSLEY